MKQRAGVALLRYAKGSSSVELTMIGQGCAQGLQLWGAVVAAWSTFGKPLEQVRNEGALLGGSFLVNPAGSRQAGMAAVASFLRGPWAGVASGLCLVGLGSLLDFLLAICSSNAGVRVSLGMGWVLACPIAVAFYGLLRIMAFGRLARHGRSSREEKE